MKASVFATASHLHPGLVIGSKAGAYFNGANYRTSL